MKTTSVPQPSLQVPKWKSGTTPTTIDRTAYQQPAPKARQCLLFWNPAETSDTSPDWLDWTISKRLGGEDLGTKSSTVTRHPSHTKVPGNGLLDFPERAAMIVDPLAVKNAVELDFDESKVIALFRKKIYNVSMWVVLSSNMSKAMVSPFNAGNGLALIRISSLLFKYCDCIRAAHNNSLKSSFKNPSNFIGKVMISVQLIDLHVRVYLGVVEILWCSY